MYSTVSYYANLNELAGARRRGAWFIVSYLSELDTFRLLGIGSVDSEAVIFDLKGVLGLSFVALAH